MIQKPAGIWFSLFMFSPLVPVQILPCLPRRLRSAGSVRPLKTRSSFCTPVLRIRQIVFLFPYRGSIFIVPSACMIRTIAGSAGVSGRFSWLAFTGRITVLPSEDTVTGGIADVAVTTVPCVDSRPLRFPSSRDAAIVTVFRSTSSAISPLINASVFRTRFSSTAIRSSSSPVVKISILLISYSWRPGSFPGNVILHSFV